MFRRVAWVHSRSEDVQRLEDDGKSLAVAKISRSRGGAEFFKRKHKDFQRLH
jgi:hypothetical protein